MDNPLFRIAFGVLFAAAFVISGYYRRRARLASGTIERSREGALALAGRMLLALPLLASILLYTLAPRLMAWASIPVPPWTGWAGVALGAVLLPFLLWVFRSIGVNISETVLTKSDHQLVTSGPYRWIRHPLYLGGLTLILSLALIAGSWFLAGAWALTLAIFRLIVIPKEEQYLTAKFGDEYSNYLGRTGALLPRLF